MAMATVARIRQRHGGHRSDRYGGSDVSGFPERKPKPRPEHFPVWYDQHGEALQFWSLAPNGAAWYLSDGGRFEMITKHEAETNGHNTPKGVSTMATTNKSTAKPNNVATVKLDLDKETKRKVRYVTDDLSAVVDAVYVSKAAFNGSGFPESITVEVRAA